MKHLRIAFFALCFSVLLCLAALAADYSENTGISGLAVADPGTTAVTVYMADGTTESVPDEFGVYPDGVRFKITYSAALPGKSYVIFVLKGGETTPTEDTIMYIDQAEAAGSVVEFNVYPMSVVSGGKVYITEAGGLLKLAEYGYYTPYTLGDVNNDGSINSLDALMALKIAAKLDTPTERQRLAADVTGDGSVSSTDALQILKYAAKLIATWQ